jgi:hypothetical protein
LTWAFPADEAHEEKHTRVTIEIDLIGDVVRLTVTHDHLEPGSEMQRGITEGWPKVLSSLKSLLEVGRPLLADPVLTGRPVALRHPKFFVFVPQLWLGGPETEFEGEKRRFLSTSLQS